MSYLGTITRGDNEVIPLAIKNGDFSPRNISSDTFTFTIKKSKYDTVPLVQKTLGNGIVKTNTTGGQIEVTIDEDDLVAINREQRFAAELEVVDSAGHPATTPFLLDFQLDLG